MSRRPPISTLFPYTPLFRSTRRTRPWGWNTGTPSKRGWRCRAGRATTDRKSTRLNSSHSQISYSLFFFNEPATPDIYTLSLHAALPIYKAYPALGVEHRHPVKEGLAVSGRAGYNRSEEHTSELQSQSNLLFPLFF